MSEIEDINKKIELAIAALDKEFGQGSVMRLTDKPSKWPSISTGAIALDIALGIGGFPVGRISEIYGPESSGKSTICLQAIANAQAEGKLCHFIDVEHALDPIYAKALGVDIQKMLLSQPSFGEEAIDIAEIMMKTGEIGITIVDSVAALTPRAELEGDMEDSQMGLQARLMSKAMRRLVGLASRTKTAVIFTNQLREKIGVVYGNPEVQPGGRALKFAASTRIDLRKIEDLKTSDGKSIYGSKVKAKVVKNKLAPPLKIAEFNVEYGRGVNKLQGLVDVASSLGVIAKSGSWYRYEGEILGQGESNAAQSLASDMDVTREIERKVYEYLGNL